jgi:hypothetical protein
LLPYLLRHSGAREKDGERETFLTADLVSRRTAAAASDNLFHIVRHLKIIKFHLLGAGK